MTRRYAHIRFARHWELSPRAHYQLGQCRGIIRAISDTPFTPERLKELLGVSLRKGAQATTAIEGNTLTEQEVERVARGESLAPSKAYQEAEVRNLIDAMNQILDEVVAAEAPERVTPELIRGFHRQIGRNLGEHLDAIPGRWREDERVVGPYRCPSFRDVPALVDRLYKWLAEEFHYPRGEQTFEDAVVEAIVAHVYLAWIHPFGDGNGRTGRLLEFYVLLRAGIPNIGSHILSNHYNDTRSEYYRQLDLAHRNGGDLTAFIAYALQGLLDGLIETLSLLQAGVFETAWKSYIYDNFAGETYRKQVFKRRRDLALAMPIGKALQADALAILTPGLARKYGKVSERTLVRDLQALIQMGLVIHVDGEYKAATADLALRRPRKLR